MRARRRSPAPSFQIGGSGIEPFRFMYRENKNSFQPHSRQMGCSCVQLERTIKAVASIAISIKTQTSRRFDEEGLGDFSPGRVRRGSGIGWLLWPYHGSL